MNTFYVSPDGIGSGSRENPASIYEIPKLIKAVNTKMISDINVFLTDGHYRLERPVILKGTDSGQNGFHVRWQNAPGARPVLSGAKKITGWEIHDQAKNIWKASVPANSDFEHIWQGDRRLVRACSGWNPIGFKNTSKGLKLTKGAPDIASWKNREEIVVTKRFMWRNYPAKIHNIVNNQVILDPEVVATYKIPKTISGGQDPIVLYGLLNGLAMWASRYHIENAYELLSDEGEWYLDKKEAVVYFKPFSTDQFNKKSVLLYSGLKTFFLLDGTLNNPVKNIAIQGIHFCYSKGTKMGVTAGSPNCLTHAVPPKPECAIQVNAGHNITLQDNYFLHMGYDAVHFDLQGKDIRLIGNGFCDISRAAISLSQTNLVISAASKKGVLPENRDKFIDGVEIRNNYIRRTGIDDISPAITYTEFTRNLNYIHNEVRDTPIHAIMSSWRYLGWKGHTANIEYAWNRSSEVGRAGLQDFGALYVSCSNAGFTKIHHNYIDGVGVASQNAGIYLDVSTDKAEVYNNVSVNMPARTMNLIYEAWVAVVMSTNVKVYNNWTDQLNFKDFDPARYRYLWGHRSNKRYDNHLIEDGKALPPEAMEVLEKAGVEPQYQQVKEFVDQVIELSL